MHKEFDSDTLKTYYVNLLFLHNKIQKNKRISIIYIKCQISSKNWFFTIPNFFHQHNIRILSAHSPSKKFIDL